MKLQELAGAKRFNGLDIEAALDSLQDFFGRGQTSLRILGTGSNGVALTDGTNVFKFWHRDSAYEKFVEFCRANPNNRFLPKFKSKVRTLPDSVFYIKSIDDSEKIHKGIKFVKMEMLEPFTGKPGFEIWQDKAIQKKIGVGDPDFDQFGILNFMSIEDIWDWSGMGSTGREVLTELLHHHAEENDVLVADLLPHLEKMNRDLIEMVATLVELHKKMERDDRLDFGSRNLAMRGEQMVILDPIVNDEDVIANKTMMNLSKYRKGGKDGRTPA